MSIQHSAFGIQGKVSRQNSIKIMREQDIVSVSILSSRMLNAEC